MKNRAGIRRILFLIIAVIFSVAFFFACGDDDDNTETEAPKQGEASFEDTSASITVLNSAKDINISVNQFLALSDGSAEGTEQGFADTIANTDGLPVRRYGNFGRLSSMQEVADLFKLRIFSEIDAEAGGIAVLGRWMNFNAPEGAPSLKNKDDNYKLEYSNDEERVTASYTHVNKARTADKFHYLEVVKESVEDVPFISSITIQIDEDYLVYKRNESLSIYYKGVMRELTVKTVEESSVFAYYEYDENSYDSDARPDRPTYVVYGTREDGFYVVDDSNFVQGAKVQYIKNGYVLAEYTNRNDFYLDFYALSGWNSLSISTAQTEVLSLGADYGSTNAVQRTRNALNFRNESEQTIIDAQNETAGEDEIIWQYDSEIGQTKVYFEGESGLRLKNDIYIGDNRQDEFDKRKTQILGVLSIAGLTWNTQKAGGIDFVLDRIKRCLSIDLSNSSAGFRPMSYLSGCPVDAFNLIGIQLTADDSFVAGAVQAKFEERISIIAPYSNTAISEINTADNSVSRWDYAGNISSRADHYLGFSASFNEGALSVSIQESMKATLDALNLGEGYNSLKYVLSLEKAGGEQQSLTLKEQSAQSEGGLSLTLSADDFKNNIPSGNYYLCLKIVADGSSARTIGLKIIDSIDTSLTGYAIISSEDSAYTGMSMLNFKDTANTNCFLTRTLF